MKKFFVLFLALGLLTCSKDDDANIISSKDLSGKWTWLKSTGGINGKTYDPTTEGKTVVLDFGSSSVKVFENGSLVSEDNFKVEIQPSIFGGSKSMLVYSSEKIKQSFEVENNILKLNDECIDCFSSEYAKK